MPVTIDRFELLPSAAPAPTQAASADQAQGQTQSGGASSQAPSRHDLLRALRLEHSRAARVRAY
jgi:hypothetical protein